MSWRLFIDLGLLFVDVSLGGVAREEGGGCAETVAVLGHRGLAGWILHHVDVLDGGFAIVGGVIYEAQIGADVARACWKVSLV